MMASTKGKGGRVALGQSLKALDHLLIPRADWVEYEVPTALKLEVVQSEADLAVGFHHAEGWFIAEFIPDLGPILRRWVGPRKGYHGPFYLD